MRKEVFKLFIFGLLFWTFRSECRDIDQLSLEEKVGQLFMSYFDGEFANRNAKRLIKETKIGGIIYYNWANQLTDPYQVWQMSKDLQNLADQYIGIPVFIAVDQEGGLVARLQEGFTEFPGNGALGKTGLPRLAYEAAYYMGIELRSVGINLNLAPVVDVNNHAENPIIGIRSFSDNEEEVACFGRECVNGFKDSGIIPCLKHFPGHGDVTIDSHIGLPVVNKSYEEMDQLELVPFKSLIGVAPAIMTAHILFPQIDPKHCATLSSRFLKNILRDRLKYEGIVISDSLTMRGVLQEGDSLEEVAIKALEAGNDVLLFGGRNLLVHGDGENVIDKMVQIYNGVVKAVREGRIAEERIDDSVSRILRVKKSFGLFESENYSPRESLKRKEHLELACEIAKKSCQIKSCIHKRNLSELNIVILSPEVLARKIRKTDLMRLGKSVVLSCYKGLDPAPEESRDILESVASSDYVIFCAYNAWKFEKQNELLRDISLLKPTTCIATRDPYDLEFENSSEVKAATFSPTACSLQIIAEWLMESIVSLNEADQGQ